MNITIDIIDTLNNSLITKDERAIASSIILDWKGGDKKDDLFIVGSSLSFEMVGMSCTDGQYIDLFTGDETRFKTIAYTPEETLWSGFILPDAYSEPYQDNPIPVKFLATDGLGRLKGKFLPEEFYEEEKSVISIIAKCLELTGLELNFRFAPAIENYQQKDYNLIYIDTRDYKTDAGKPIDAYHILKELINDMVSTIYQADNVWNIEGLNIRNMRVYKTKIYNSYGLLIDEVEVTRLKKSITPLATPTITMQPPYGLISVTHPRKDISFPKTLSEEKNDGWVLIRRNIIYYLYATDWFGYGGFHAKAANAKNLFYTTSNIRNRKEYAVYFGRGNSSTQYLTVRDRPYLRKDNKYIIKINFQLLLLGGYQEPVKQQFIDDGLWNNPFNIQIALEHQENGGTVVDVLFANYGVTVTGNRFIPQSFGMDGTTENTLEFVANKSGILNIMISPVDEVLNGIEGVAFDEVTIETVGFQDLYTEERVLNDEYTVTKEIELTYADDFTGFSKGFRLKRLREKDNFNFVDVPILRQFTRDGVWFQVVDLQGANLIKENPDVVYIQGNKVEILDVIYNYGNSEDFVIKLSESVNFGSFTVYVYDYNTVKENREYWEQWTDSIYKIEKLRYPQVVANIYNRSFDVPIPKVDYTLKNNIKFNDFLDFQYVNPKQWILTNCKWNMDKGFSTVTAIESYYAVSTGSNIPPVVEAGNDISITGGQLEAQLTSESYDPDGFIVSVFWEEVTNNGATIPNPTDENITVSGLTGDFYTFRVTVTDNDGATASDTVNVYRNQEHTLIINETIVTDVTQHQERYYILEFDPNIAAGAALNIKGKYSVNAGINDPYNSASAYIRILINGAYLRNDEQGTGYNGNDPVTYVSDDNFSIDFVNGDVLRFEIKAEANIDDPDLSSVNPFANSEFTIESIDFTTGTGTLTGYPVTKRVEVL